MFSSAREETSPAPRSWRERAGRALGLARTLVTPAEVGPTVPAEPLHPHRRPLRPNPRTRRPGAGSPRVQLCATPLERDAPRRLVPAGRLAPELEPRR